MMLRPIRPNPLIPTLTAIVKSPPLTALAARMCPRDASKPLIVMNGLHGGQTA